MSRDDLGDAGAQAGAHDSKAVIALRLQPIDGGASLGDCLPAGVDRPAHVAAHHVIGALAARGGPVVMIGQAHAKSGKPEKIQQAAKIHVPLPVGVPLRQDHHRPSV